MAKIKKYQNVSRNRRRISLFSFVWVVYLGKILHTDDTHKLCVHFYYYYYVIPFHINIKRNIRRIKVMLSHNHSRLLEKSRNIFINVRDSFIHHHLYKKTKRKCSWLKMYIFISFAYFLMFLALFVHKLYANTCYVYFLSNWSFATGF